MSKELQRIKDERNRRREEGTFGDEHTDYEALKKNMSLWDKICNFLYHYKYHILVFGFFVVASIYTLCMTVFAPKPDYTVLVFTKQNTESVYGLVLEEELAQYGEDVNGDGKVIVQVTDCTTDEDGENLLNAAPKVSEYMAEMEVGENIIYLLDDDRYSQVEKYFAEIDVGDGFAEVKDGKVKIDISDSELMKNTRSGFKNLYFCIRDTGEDMDQRVEEARILLRNIQEGKKNDIAKKAEDNK